MLTTLEDYLRTIYSLHEKSPLIRSVDIASNLNISRASVSMMLKKLTDEGYIEAEKYSKIKLTRKGLIWSKNIMKKHRVIEVFLTRFLGYEPDKVHEEAHKLEHAFSKESIDRLNIMLESPAKSPTGKEIPR